jgi:hypothetical protein
MGKIAAVSIRAVSLGAEDEPVGAEAKTAKPQSTALTVLPLSPLLLLDGVGVVSI